MKGIKTNCVSGKETEVTIEYVIEQVGDNRVFRLINGVTGYESFGMNKNDPYSADLDCIREHGWSACAGTKNRWDKLFIPADEMKEALKDE